MEFRHLRYFLTLAEELHFGRAAQRLAISQPPLSLNIQQLEHSIGTQLFIRNSKQVRLTDAGRAFIPRAKGLLAQADAAARHAKDVGEGISGRLTIGFVGSMLYRQLPKHLHEFQAKHPTLRVSLREFNSNDQLQELLHDRLDMGFVHTERVPSELAKHPCSSESFLCCLPANHPLVKPKQSNPKSPSSFATSFADIQQENIPFEAIRIEELKNESLVLFSRNTSPDYHERIVSMLSNAGLDFELHHEGRHWLSVVSMVAQGLGIALVPSVLSRANVGGVVFVPLADFPYTSDVYCVWKPSNENVALRTLINATLQKIQSLRTEIETHLDEEISTFSSPVLLESPSF